MLNCLAVGVGGFVGAVLRYLVSMIPLDKTGAFCALYVAVPFPKWQYLKTGDPSVG